VLLQSQRQWLPGQRGCTSVDWTAEVGAFGGESLNADGLLHRLNAFQAEAAKLFDRLLHSCFGTIGCSVGVPRNGTSLAPRVRAQPFAADMFKNTYLMHCC